MSTKVAWGMSLVKKGRSSLSAARFNGLLQIILSWLDKNLQPPHRAQMITVVNADECLEIGWSHRREVSVLKESRFVHPAYLRAEVVQVLSCTDRRFEVLVVTLSKLIS